MKAMHRLTLFALLLMTACGYPAEAPAQVQTRYYMVGSFASVTEQIAAGDTTYRVTMNFQADQSGNDYLATGIQVGYRIFTAARRLYRVDTLHSASPATAELTVRPVTGTLENQAPSLTAMAYQYDGSSQSLPVPPANQTGVSQAMSAAILTHNAAVAGEGLALDYGRIRFVNKTFGNNATARIGDPARPWKDFVAAAFAPDQRSGDVIYTYDSQYQYNELSTRLGQNRRDIINPRDGVVFHFDRVRVTGNPSVGETLFNIDLGPNGTVPELDDSTTYRLDVRGDLDLENVGFITTWSDPGRLLSDGSPVPKFAINFRLGAVRGVTVSNNEYLIGMNGPDIEATGYVRTYYAQDGPAVNLSQYGGMGSTPFTGKRLNLFIDELRLNATSKHPAALSVTSAHKTDSATVNVNVNRVIAPRYQGNLSSDRGYYSRLLNVVRGATLTNSEINLTVGLINVPNRRSSAYAGQSTRDYFNVPYASNQVGEEARMVRFSGNLAGSKIAIDCGSCTVEDGFLLMDQPTGTGGSLHLTGNIHSVEQSVAKFAHDGGPSVFLDGHFSSQNAPVVSSDLDGNAGLSRIHLTGTYVTRSTSFPAVALNRAMVGHSMLLERLSSSGTRPAIESNVAGTNLLWGGVYHNGSGLTIGPNISPTPLKTVGE